MVKRVWYYWLDLRLYTPLPTQRIMASVSSNTIWKIVGKCTILFNFQSWVSMEKVLSDLFPMSFHIHDLWYSNF